MRARKLSRNIVEESRFFGAEFDRPRFFRRAGQMRGVGTGYVTCGAREDRRLPVVDGDENVPMCRNGRLFMSGAKINALVPARCGNRRLSRPIRRNGRLILLWWAAVGRAAVNVNALHCFT